MVTANVPSAKKIVVHGPDSSSIPSQFPIQEVISCSLANLFLCCSLMRITLFIAGHGVSNNFNRQC